MSRNGGRKKSRLADMSLPAEVRIIKKKGKKIGGTPPAQMSHNTKNVEGKQKGKSKRKGK